MTDSVPPYFPVSERLDTITKEQLLAYAGNASVGSPIHIVTELIDSDQE